MKLFWVSCVLGLSLSTTAWGLCPVPDREGNWGQKSLNNYAAKADLSRFNIGNDSILEIQSMSFLSKQNSVKGPFKEKMIMFIEPRLLEQGADSVLFGLNLLAYQTQLAREGIDVLPLKLKVYGHSYADTIKQDGQTLLGIRRLVKELYSCASGSKSPVKGVLLTGRFPEARIARRFVLPDGEDFRIRAEVVAESADIVLSDLDGNWEPAYRQNIILNDIRCPMSSLNPIKTGQSREAFYDLWNKTLFCKSPSVLVNPMAMKDAFSLPDEFALSLGSNNSGPYLKVVSRMGKGEDSLDLASGKIMAFPEIQVSRVNAYGTALTPSGSPDMMVNQRASSFMRMGVAVIGMELFQPNVKFEIELLINYFVRNIRYRNKEISVVEQASMVTGTEEFSTGSQLADLQPIYGKNANLIDSADVVDFYEWMLKDNSLFKGVIAHSSPSSSSFDPKPETSGESFELMNQRLGQYFHRPEDKGILEELFFWSAMRQSNDQVRQFRTATFYDPFRFPVSSANGNFRNSDLVIDHLVRYHSAFKNKAVGDRAHFYFHGGCNAASPNAGDVNMFSSNIYGKGRVTNSFLFLGEGLAVIGRSKTYNDNILKASKVLGNRDARIGDIIPNYFRMHNSGEIRDTYMPKHHSKEPYFWNLAGDYSLRMHRSLP